MQAKIGIIGGSGLYDIDGLEDAQWVTVESPWGTPSDQLLCGRLNGVDMVFLPRHGRGHVYSPSTVPYRANIDALKRIGCTDIISVSACGSFREDMAPGDFVIVSDFIDRTFARKKSFFGTGCVAHVSVAHPVCPRLGDACETAARAAGVTVHRGGTYLAMEGPQFSSLAESKLYREVWGCDVIGMTNMPEAKLAREAELCYASVAMITDYDSWHPDHGSVDISDIIATLGANSAAAKQMVAGLSPLIGGVREVCPFGSALLIASPLAAQEYIVTDGPLSDVDFYRLVSCAATPGFGCNEPIIKWDKPVVRVTFAPIPMTYPTDKARELSRALDTTIVQINSAAPGLNLARVPKSSQADIVIFLQSIRTGQAIRGTGYSQMDGVPIGAAQVQVFWDSHLNLTEAAIVFAADIPIPELGPIMVEELSQAMGLMTDIRNPYYDSRSVFSEDSNNVAKLGVQDRAALLLHYPGPLTLKELP
ncbi:S-methyl-5'-thioadenosine phosphorylase [Nymphon striatum]|nr:S-methyl-5'-thioadenosine phosphorylase [Nymphon striatum]